jgi:hypothetical protein
LIGVVNDDETNYDYEKRPNIIPSCPEKCVIKEIAEANQDDESANN